MSETMTRRRMLARLGLAGLSLAILSACSPGPVQVSRSMSDPSNPSAPEGAAPASDHDHGAHASDGGTEGVVYTCPMHPEVMSNAPGVCPKCNMKLVPKK
jgi:hypothetical protein